MVLPIHTSTNSVSVPLPDVNPHEEKISATSTVDNKNSSTNNKEKKHLNGTSKYFSDETKSLPGRRRKRRDTTSPRSDSPSHRIRSLFLRPVSRCIPRNTSTQSVHCFELLNPVIEEPFAVEEVFAQEKSVTESAAADKPTNSSGPTPFVQMPRRTSPLITHTLDAVIGSKAFKVYVVGGREEGEFEIELPKVNAAVLRRRPTNKKRSKHAVAVQRALNSHATLSALLQWNKDQMTKGMEKMVRQAMKMKPLAVYAEKQKKLQQSQQPSSKLQPPRRSQRLSSLSSKEVNEELKKDKEDPSSHQGRRGAQSQPTPTSLHKRQLPLKVSSTGKRPFPTITENNNHSGSIWPPKPNNNHNGTAVTPPFQLIDPDRMETYTMMIRETLQLYQEQQQEQSRRPMKKRKLLT